MPGFPTELSKAILLFVFLEEQFFENRVCLINIKWMIDCLVNERINLWSDPSGKSLSLYFYSLFPLSALNFTHLPPLSTLFPVANGISAFRPFQFLPSASCTLPHRFRFKSLFLTHTLQKTSRKPVMTLHCLESLYSSHL